VITKSAILISAQFNISPHYSFMVQNQITVSLCLTLLWSSTVGYPSDSLAFCISAYHKIEIRVRRLRWICR